ncbi:hypothetical protein GDO78_000970 [Eleutherodactylus coqui]|uniref:Uncharacterized protein n=1 Tax=Eleutherodactylus coqui TaxID=57060 RepID=A0A8J6KG85_ELECQ|nr:hypothetical protein GDO78_000970 [Eleutherodactylus coqui]
MLILTLCFKWFLNGFIVRDSNLDQENDCTAITAIPQTVASVVYFILPLCGGLFYFFLFVFFFFLCSCNNGGLLKM